MQFNSIRNANAGNYIAAGRAGAKATAGIFDAIKKNSPDYAGLVRTVRDAQSSKAQSAMKANADALQGRILGDEIVKRQQFTSDLALATTKAKEKRRFAGFLGALGSDLAKDWVDLKRPAKKEPPTAMPYQSNADGLINSRLERIDQMLDSMGGEGPPTAPQLGDYIQNGNAVPNPPGPPTSPSAGGALSPNEIERTQVQGAARPSTPVAGIPTRDQLLPAMSTVDVRNTFLRAGATPSQADRFAYQIVPAESGGIPNNNTITSGLVNRAGETSYGIAQINMFDTQDPVEHRRRLNMFGIERSTDLLNPDVNARAAMKILDEQGWGAWSTYDPSVVY